MCDGVSMLDVTHDEAAQAFKRAMDMESVSEEREKEEGESKRLSITNRSLSDKEYLCISP